jgi:hypothetical protein
MICPIKPQAFDTREGCYPDAECDRELCAWWNERFGMCCQAVDAYLKGQEDRRSEQEIVRRGG